MTDLKGRPGIEDAHVIAIAKEVGLDDHQRNVVSCLACHQADPQELREPRM
jgi:hypothetical protein